MAADERDHFLFTYACRWADDVRGLSKYYPSVEHRDFWHYIDYPFVDPDATGMTGPEPDPNNLEKAYYSNRKGAKTSGKKGAQSLVWMFHLIGDAHQPLHAASYFSNRDSEYSDADGDRGGNEFFVKLTATGAANKLHSYWDGLVQSDEAFAKVSTKATQLMAKYPESALQELSVTAFNEWVGESYHKAVEVAYANGAIKGVPEAKKASAPVAPAGYATKAKDTAERRAVLAGIRLAKVLAAL